MYISAFSIFPMKSKFQYSRDCFSSFLPFLFGSQGKASSTFRYHNELLFKYSLLGIIPMNAVIKRGVVCSWSMPKIDQLSETTSFTCKCMCSHTHMWVCMCVQVSRPLQNKNLFSVCRVPATVPFVDDCYVWLGENQSGEQAETQVSRTLFF